MPRLFWKYYKKKALKEKGENLKGREELNFNGSAYKTPLI